MSRRTRYLRHAPTLKAPSPLLMSLLAGAGYLDDTPAMKAVRAAIEKLKARGLTETGRTPSEPQMQELPAS
jgi:hypothetical protein